VAQWAKVAEDLGYARLGIGDSPALFRDPWMTLALVAAATERMPIGIWVTNPMTRHPVVTASAAATLNEAAPGRVFVGIATGDSGIASAGLSPARIDSLAEYVDALRDLFDRGATRYRGGEAHLDWPDHPLPIPIYVAAHGEKSIHLAGRIADGVVIGLGITDEVVGRSLGWLQQGVAAGRRESEIDVWWTVRYLVGEVGQAAREEMAGILAEAAHVIARTAFRSGLGTPGHREGVEALAAEFDRSTYGKGDVQSRRRRGRRADELGVAEPLLERFAFAGSPDQCAEQVQRAVRAGAHQFMYSMRGPDQAQRMRDWHALVMQPLQAGLDAV
jgi:5,10-methylenetetrahydromethanopterin reductase